MPTSGITRRRGKPKGAGKTGPLELWQLLLHAQTDATYEPEKHGSGADTQRQLALVLTEIKKWDADAPVPWEGYVRHQKRGWFEANSLKGQLRRAKMLRDEFPEFFDCFSYAASAWWDLNLKYDRPRVPVMAIFKSAIALRVAAGKISPKRLTAFAAKLPNVYLGFEDEILKMAAEAC